MKIFKSIRWQLLVWQMILLAGVLVTLLTLHYQLEKRDLIAEVDAELQETLLAVMPVISPLQGAQQGGRQGGRMPPPGDMLFSDERPPPRQRPPQSGGLTEEVKTELLSEMEQKNIYLAVKGALGVEQVGQVPSSLMTGMPKSVLKPQKVIRDGNRELIQPHPQVLIVLGQPLTDVYADLAITRLYLVAIGCAVLLVGIILGWLITGRALRPVRQISATARTIAAGEHHRRIELSDAPEELASLAQTLNSSFDHLAETIEIQKRFSADASHELRTPIAVVIAQTEAALKRKRTTEEYQSVLNACLRAGQRMKTLANSLLELNRLSGVGFELSKERGDLNVVLAAAVDSGSLLSENHPVVFQGFENPQNVAVDPDRIHQVVMNLIFNAVQHNPQGCDITVSLKPGGIIEVADTGMGIPEESLPHIFERFYRVDKSRSRQLGGAGLGLSIVKSLVEAHGGQITVDSEPNQGTRFTIILPVE